MEYIRNFSIIAHIDHGKSTLADRLLEETETVSSRSMKDQVLDQMELERERGITIKMAPVRMLYTYKDNKYILNLIDTPGHIDFAYEVSRALKAVEGVVLLVDATQGVQAQTLTTLDMARKLNLIILAAVSKVDSPYARVDEVKLEVAEIVGCDVDDVLEVSGKTGQGVTTLLEKVIDNIPSPKTTLEISQPRALVFDFEYSSHKGVVVYSRLFDGSIRKGDTLTFSQAGRSFSVLETGIFVPHEKPSDSLTQGEIGYIVTGIKEAGIASVGDTLIQKGSKTLPLPGYLEPKPVIWASVFPESQDDFTNLRQALGRLKLSDSSLSFEEESSGVLGRGYRCGFLGMLHLEIIMERLHREFDLRLIATSPSITYEVTEKNGETSFIYSPSLFPEHGDISHIREQWVKVELITPPEYIDVLMQLFFEHEAEVLETSLFVDGRTSFILDMPLRELMRNFFDAVKRVSSGYASLSYELQEGWRDAEVAELSVFVAEEKIPAFSRIVSKRRLEEESKDVVNKLYELLPQQLTKTKIQALALGRIISSKTISALRKDVTGYLYGGDITRKMKLREKQKRGKKKMQERAKASIPHEVFLKMMKD